MKCDTARGPNENPSDDIGVINSSRRAANVNENWLMLRDDTGALYGFEKSGSGPDTGDGRGTIVRLSPPGKQQPRTAAVQPANKGKTERPPGPKDGKPDAAPGFAGARGPGAVVTSGGPRTGTTATYRQINIVCRIKSENVTNPTAAARPSAGGNRDYRDNFYRAGAAAVRRAPPSTVDDTADPAVTIATVNPYDGHYGKITTIIPDPVGASAPDGPNDNRERSSGNAERISLSDNKTAGAANGCDDAAAPGDCKPHTPADSDQCPDDTCKPSCKTREMCNDNGLMLLVENNIRLKLVANSAVRTVFREGNDGGTKAAPTTNANAIVLVKMPRGESNRKPNIDLTRATPTDDISD